MDDKTRALHATLQDRSLSSPALPGRGAGKTVPGHISMPLRSDVDVLKARQEGKALAAVLRFSNSELTTIATAISEIARNTVLYATGGQISLDIVHQGRKKGLQIIAKDQGPGIPDLSLAMQDGYTTSHGLGIGLPGAKRLMDEFEIASESGKGTTIIMRKWER